MEEMNNIEDIMIRRQPRRQPRCSQCNQQGHNISTCPIFELFHNEAIENYKTWLQQCIVDYHLHQWQYTPEVRDTLDETFRTELDELRLLPYPMGLETLLKRHNAWIKSKSRDELKILGRVYNLNRYIQQYQFTDDELREILHILLLIEADRKLVNGVNLTEVLPYLQYSIISFSLFHNIVEHFHSIPNIDASHIFLINYLHVYTIRERVEKIKRLHASSLRSIRTLRTELISNQGDLSRINRELRELRQRRERLQQEQLRLSNSRTRIEQRLEVYESEFTLFNFLPEDPPVIQFEQQTFKYEEPVDCPICLDPISLHNISRVDCHHTYCASCIVQTLFAKYSTLYRANAENFKCYCPLCRSELNKVYGNVDVLFNTLENLCKPSNVSFQDIRKIIGGKKTNNDSPMNRQMMSFITNSVTDLVTHSNMSLL